MVHVIHLGRFSYELHKANFIRDKGLTRAYGILSHTSVMVCIPTMNSAVTFMLRENVFTCGGPNHYSSGLGKETPQSRQPWKNESPFVAF